MDQTLLELIVALLLVLVFIATCCALALAVYLNDLAAPRSPWCVNAGRDPAARPRAPTAGSRNASARSCVSATLRSGRCETTRPVSNAVAVVMA